MTSRLLLVEPSATMRYVLQKHAESLGFAIEAVESYEVAAHVLTGQFSQFGADFVGLLFGWPTVPDEQAAVLALLLEQQEFHDLPVLVMSTDMRAETRAWVAGRDSTAVLAWKEYRGIDKLLSQLIDSNVADGETFDSKFDNSDIHILVVDDSATIRQSLQDMFQLQGYRVSVAADEVQALAVVRSDYIDIAILDFYLTDTTGDAVCRSLIAEVGSGEIVCAVLTGTYSDHIIKRSLRAGAVECMFKNESSELLLARIDAISRFVRQRRNLQSDRQLLDRVVDAVAGATVVLDAQQRITYLSQQALIELKLDDASGLLGQNADVLVETTGVAAAGRERNAIWRRPDGSEVGVSYTRYDVADTDGTVLCFRNKDLQSISGESTRQSVRASQQEALPGSDQASPTASVKRSAQTMAQTATQSAALDSGAYDAARNVAPDAARDSAGSAGSARDAAQGSGQDTANGSARDTATGANADAIQAADAGKARAATQIAALVHEFALHDEAQPFLSCLQRYLIDADSMSERVSLLLIDVFVVDSQGQLYGIDSIDGLQDVVHSTLRNIYRREHHVAALQANRYGFLLRHVDESQAYLLTRKIMQLCNEVRHPDAPAIACTASLLSVSEHTNLPARALLHHGFKGVELVNSRGANQALLLDLKRMLSVYPKDTP